MLCANRLSCARACPQKTKKRESEAETSTRLTRTPSLLSHTSVSAPRPHSGPTPTPDPQHHVGQQELHPAHAQDDEEPAAGPPPDGAFGVEREGKKRRGGRRRSRAGRLPRRPGASSAKASFPRAHAGRTAACVRRSCSGWHCEAWAWGARDEAAKQATPLSPVAAAAAAAHPPPSSPSLSPPPPLRSWTSSTRAAPTCPRPRSRRSSRRCGWPGVLGEGGGRGARGEGAEAD